MKLKLFLFAMLFISAICPVSSQIETKTDVEHSKFVPEYERWLKLNHLNHFLLVRDIITENNKTKLCLEFKVDPDSLSMYWHSIDKKLNTERGYGIDSLLYFAGINIFKVPPVDFTILICDNYNSPIYKVALYYNAYNKSILSYKDFPQGKGQPQDLNIEVGVSGDKSTTFSLENFNMQRSDIYSKINQILKDYYSQYIVPNLNINDNYVNREQNENLIVSVSNIKNQILPNEPNHWIAQLANYFFNANCNWKRIESIDLIINLTFVNNKNLKLSLSVTAKYGSGILNVTNWSNAQNYEPEYEIEVRNYTLKIADYINKNLIIR